MELPDTNMLNFFNKVLISLSELDPDGNSCSIESLINQCKSTVFSGQRGDYDSVLNHCKHCGLVQIKNRNATISALGQKFLNANKERYFEITEAQKQLIVAESNSFSKGPWNNHARELVRFFYVTGCGNCTYELSILESVLPFKVPKCSNTFF